jgi:putative transcription antitermination factor YqgF
MILALDYGEKRIGVAITDEKDQFAASQNYISNSSELKRVATKDFPKGTPVKEIVEARKAAKREAKVEMRKLLNKIYYLINSHYPDKILIGLPLTIDKNTSEWVEGQQALKVKKFAKTLESFCKSKKIVCDIELVEESMSSSFARDNLKEMSLTESKIKEKIDSESARILLEEYLNKVKSGK